MFVVPSRIELEYQVPETCVLSIVLRDQLTCQLKMPSELAHRHISESSHSFDQPCRITRKHFHGNSQQNYTEKLSYC